MTSATEFENVGNQPPYSRINARWDAPDDELDNDNSSARLFERSRIKALAGTVGAVGVRGAIFTIPRFTPLLVCGESPVCTGVSPGRVLMEIWLCGSERLGPHGREHRLEQPLLPRVPHFLPGGRRCQVGPALCPE